MNYIGLWTVYKREIFRLKRILGQAIIFPIVSTVLYFVVFGAALGETINEIQGVTYAAYIIPGLVMLSLIQISLSAAAFTVYMPKFLGHIYELLSAPLSYLEICMGFVLASMSRAFVVVAIIMMVSLAFVSYSILYPMFTVLFMVLVSLSFALLGFIVGLVSKTFDQLSLAPNFIITPLSFLGGIFYSIEILPPFWQTVSLFNPFVYMINGLRYGFYGITDVSPVLCLSVVVGFCVINLMIILWIFRTGYRLRS